MKSRNKLIKIAIATCFIIGVIFLVITFNKSSSQEIKEQMEQKIEQLNIKITDAEIKTYQAKKNLEQAISGYNYRSGVLLKLYSDKKELQLFTQAQ